MSGIIKIPLTKGYVAIIDQCDEALAEFRWHAKEEANGRVYAARNIRMENGRYRTSRLHREVIGDACIGLHVDHIDGDCLNNRRSNLRAVEEAVNHHNLSGARSDSASKILGVDWNKRSNRWRAQIRANGQKIHLGFFRTVEEASAARLAAEAELWGIQPRRSSAHGSKNGGTR